MEILSLSEAKIKLSALIEALQSDDEEVNASPILQPGSLATGLPHFFVD